MATEARNEHAIGGEILLVDDSPAFVRLATEALRETEAPCRLRVVRDGFEALAYLRREGQYASAARPDIILLDLNLPGKDGRKVLQELKHDPDLRLIPVLVLSTSSARTDVTQAYALDASCYIQKPLHFDQLVEIMREIGRFWLRMVTLPPQATMERNC